MQVSDAEAVAGQLLAALQIHANTSTPQEQRAAVEGSLQAFKHQPGAWQTALVVLAAAQSQGLDDACIFYLLSVLQEQARWQGLSQQALDSLYQSLAGWLLGTLDTLSSFAANKAAQVLAITASSIEGGTSRLVAQGRACLEGKARLGLLLLTAAVEEAGAAATAQLGQARGCIQAELRRTLPELQATVLQALLDLLRGVSGQGWFPRDNPDVTKHALICLEKVLSSSHALQDGQLSADLATLLFQLISQVGHLVGSTEAAGADVAAAAFDCLTALVSQRLPPAQTCILAATLAPPLTGLCRDSAGRGLEPVVPVVRLVGLFTISHLAALEQTPALQPAIPDLLQGMLTLTHAAGGGHLAVHAQMWLALLAHLQERQEAFEAESDSAGAAAAWSSLSSQYEAGVMALADAYLHTMFRKPPWYGLALVHKLSVEDGSGASLAEAIETVSHGTQESFEAYGSEEGGQDNEEKGGGDACAPPSEQAMYLRQCDTLLAAILDLYSAQMVPKLLQILLSMAQRYMQEGHSPPVGGGKDAWQEDADTELRCILPLIARCAPHFTTRQQEGHQVLSLLLELVSKCPFPATVANDTARALALMALAAFGATWLPTWLAAPGTCTPAAIPAHVQSLLHAYLAVVTTTLTSAFEQTRHQRQQGMPQQPERDAMLGAAAQPGCFLQYIATGREDVVAAVDALLAFVIRSLLGSVKHSPAVLLAALCMPFTQELLGVAALMLHPSSARDAALVQALGPHPCRKLYTALFKLTFQGRWELARLQRGGRGTDAVSMMQSLPGDPYPNQGTALLAPLLRTLERGPADGEWRLHKGLELLISLSEGLQSAPRDLRKAIYQACMHEAVQACVRILQHNCAVAQQPGHALLPLALLRELMRCVVASVAVFSVEMGLPLVQELISVLLRLPQDLAAGQHTSQMGVTKTLLAMLCGLLSDGHTRFRPLQQPAAQFCCQAWAAATPAGDRTETAAWQLRADALVSLMRILMFNWRAMSPMTLPDGQPLVRCMLSMLRDWLGMASTQNVAPADTRLVLDAMLYLHTQVKQDVHSQETRFEMLAALLNMLRCGLHGSAQDQITANVVSLAAVNLQGFREAFLPRYLAATPSLESHERGALLQAFPVADDAPTLSAGILALMGDIIWSEQRARMGYVPAGSATELKRKGDEAAADMEAKRMRSS